MPDSNPELWKEYQLLVLHRLDSLEASHAAQDKVMMCIREELVALRTRQAVWSAGIAAVVGVAVSLLTAFATI